LANDKRVYNVDTVVDVAPNKESKVENRNGKIIQLLRKLFRKLKMKFLKLT
jgi:hypothetical protein